MSGELGAADGAAAGAAAGAGGAAPPHPTGCCVTVHSPPQRRRTVRLVVDAAIVVCYVIAAALGSDMRANLSNNMYGIAPMEQTSVSVAADNRTLSWQVPRSVATFTLLLRNPSSLVAPVPGPGVFTAWVPTTGGHQPMELVTPRSDLTHRTANLADRGTPALRILYFSTMSIASCGLLLAFAACAAVEDADRTRALAFVVLGFAPVLFVNLVVNADATGVLSPAPPIIVSARVVNVVGGTQTITVCGASAASATACVQLPTQMQAELEWELPYDAFQATMHTTATVACRSSDLSASALLECVEDVMRLLATRIVQVLVPQDGAECPVVLRWGTVQCTPVTSVFSKDAAVSEVVLTVVFMVLVATMVGGFVGGMCQP